MEAFLFMQILKPGIFNRGYLTEFTLLFFYYRFVEDILIREYIVKICTQHIEHICARLNTYLEFAIKCSSSKRAFAILHDKFWKK